MPLNRRQFIKTTLAGAALCALPVPFFSRACSSQRLLASPIHKIGDQDLFSTDFNGDDIHRPHEALWNLEGFIQSRGGIPKPSETASVVIIGGGLSGLASAYHLKDLNPVVLEQDRFFGGNAKGERYKDASYTMGSTYIGAPTPGSDTANFLTELGVLSNARIESSEAGTVFYQGQFMHGFWQAATDAKAQKQFHSIFESLKKINASGLSNGLYGDRKMSAEMKRLDAISFSKWLKENHGNVHPHLLEYFQLYAWSAMLASIDEVSAAQMLSFVAAETAEILIFPGGNSAISQAMYEKLDSKLGSSQLRNECLVVDVRCTPDGVEICYDDKDRKLRTIKAKACIIASPKFVAKKIVRDLPAVQLKAMNKITHRSFLVGNIILDRPVNAPSFELYCLNGAIPPNPTLTKPSERGFTDLCFATWASHNKTKHGVITVYNGLAYDGARRSLFSPDAHDKFRDQVSRDIEPILKALGLTHKNIHGMRFTRWGHAMPVAHPGLISSGIAEAAHQPVQNKIFFANQDNWGNPCFESAFTEASWAAKLAREIVI